MKSIDQLMQKATDAVPRDSQDRIDLVDSEESLTLSGGDQEYKPVYDELGADEHFRFGSSSVYNFFDNLF